MTSCKKFIEVALPFVAINRESRKEKFIQHGLARGMHWGQGEKKGVIQKEPLHGSYHILECANI
jgi:hypothetical protein